MTKRIRNSEEERRSLVKTNEGSVVLSVPQEEKNAVQKGINIFRKMDEDQRLNILLQSPEVRQFFVSLCEYQLPVPAVRLSADEKKYGNFLEWYNHRKYVVLNKNTHSIFDQIVDSLVEYIRPDQPEYQGLESRIMFLKYVHIHFISRSLSAYSLLLKEFTSWRIQGVKILVDAGTHNKKSAVSVLTARCDQKFGLKFSTLLQDSSRFKVLDRYPALCFSGATSHEIRIHSTMFKREVEEQDDHAFWEQTHSRPVVDGVFDQLSRMLEVNLDLLTGTKEDVIIALKGPIADYMAEFKNPQEFNFEAGEWVDRPIFETTIPQILDSARKKLENLKL